MTCAVKQALRLVDPKKQDEARVQVIGVLSKLRSAKGNPLALPERQALKRLKDNEKIAILPADKGNATVVLNCTDYILKMEDLLQDYETYTLIKCDPTQKIEGELQKLLFNVFQFVPPESKHLYYKLLFHNGSAPAIYGLPKVHKPDVPVRPIVDLTRSPLHRLSGYLHSVIRLLVGKTSMFKPFRVNVKRVYNRRRPHHGLI